jgi:hypothetical protein
VVAELAVVVAAEPVVEVEEKVKVVAPVEVETKPKLKIIEWNLHNIRYL